MDPADPPSSVDAVVRSAAAQIDDLRGSAGGLPEVHHRDSPSKPIKVSRMVESLVGLSLETAKDAVQDKQAARIHRRMTKMINGGASPLSTQRTTGNDSVSSFGSSPGGGTSLNSLSSFPVKKTLKSALAKKHAVSTLGKAPSNVGKVLSNLETAVDRDAAVPHKPVPQSKSKGAPALPDAVGLENGVVPGTLVPERYHRFAEQELGMGKPKLEFPVKRPRARNQVQFLEQTLDQMLTDTKALCTNETELVHASGRVYSIVFHELVRQVACESSERANLLAKVWSRYYEILKAMAELSRKKDKEIERERAALLETCRAQARLEIKDEMETLSEANADLIRSNELQQREITRLSALRNADQAVMDAEQKDISDLKEKVRHLTIDSLQPAEGDVELLHVLRRLTKVRNTYIGGPPLEEASEFHPIELSIIVQELENANLSTSAQIAVDTSGMQTMTPQEVMNMQWEIVNQMESQARELDDWDMLQDAKQAAQKLQQQRNDEIAAMKKQLNDEVRQHKNMEEQLRADLQDMALQGHGVRSGSGGSAPQGGTMSLVFTDIQGSTNLWEWNPVIMKEAQRVHDEICRETFHRHNGYEVNTEGDAFEVAFHTAVEAVAWCLDLQLAMMEVKWPQELLETEWAKQERSSDGRLLFNGVRVRMGVHTGVPQQVAEHEVTKRTYYKGQFFQESKVLGDSGAGGQILVSRETYNEISKFLPQLKQPEAIHLGENVLKGLDKPMEVLQILPKQLSGRKFGELKVASKLSSSMMDAPHGDSVTLVFTNITGYADVAEAMPDACDQALSATQTLIRSLLRQWRGYECQEKYGSFMLSFHTTMDATQFCLGVQTALLYIPWPEELGQAEVCKEVWDMSEEGGVLFKGFRLQMSILTGKPTECRPHNLTGRMDYFGPIVNRAARIMGFSRGGQILINESSFAVVKEDLGELGNPSVADLGLHTLKGVEKKERLLELLPASLAARGLYFGGTNRQSLDEELKAAAAEELMLQKKTKEEIQASQKAFVHVVENGSSLLERHRLTMEQVEGILFRQMQILIEQRVGSSLPDVGGGDDENGRGYILHVKNHVSQVNSFRSTIEKSFRTVGNRPILVKTLHKCLTHCLTHYRVLQKHMNLIDKSSTTLTKARSTSERWLRGFMAIKKRPTFRAAAAAKLDQYEQSVELLRFGILDRLAGTVAYRFSLSHYRLIVQNAVFRLSAALPAGMQATSLASLSAENIERAVMILKTFLTDAGDHLRVVEEYFQSIQKDVVFRRQAKLEISVNRIFVDNNLTKAEIKKLELDLKNKKKITEDPPDLEADGPLLTLAPIDMVNEAKAELAADAEKEFVALPTPAGASSAEMPLTPAARGDE